MGIPPSAGLIRVASSQSKIDAHGSDQAADDFATLVEHVRQLALDAEDRDHASHIDEPCKTPPLVRQHTASPAVASLELMAELGRVPGCRAKQAADIPQRRTG